MGEKGEEEEEEEVMPRLPLLEIYCKIGKSEREERKVGVSSSSSLLLTRSPTQTARL